MSLDAAIVLARWAFFAASTVCFGLALFPFYSSPARAYGAAGLVAGAAAVALAAALGWLGLAVVAFGGRDPASFAQVLGALLFATSLGPAWLVRLGAGAALVIAAVVWPRSRAVVVLAGVVLATEAAIGHGAVHGRAYQAAQVLHLLAAGAWLGGLVGLARALRSGAADCAGVLLRFSAVGVLSVATIAATGVLCGWAVLGRVPGEAAYDRLLVLKVGLFAAMLLAAAYNRFWLVPRIGAGSSGALARLRVSIFGEQALGACVLLVAGVLGVTDPGVQGAGWGEAVAPAVVAHGPGRGPAHGDQPVQPAGGGVEPEAGAGEPDRQHQRRLHVTIQHPAAESVERHQDGGGPERHP
jgi:putative copper resistance protein D